MSSLVESSKSKFHQNAISYVVRVTTAPFTSTGNFHSKTFREILRRFEKLERIWRLEKLEEFQNAKVTALEWRPDGRAVAIAYRVGYF